MFNTVLSHLLTMALFNILLIVYFVVDDVSSDNKIGCGFPGVPADAEVKPMKDFYPIDTEIRYQCAGNLSVFGKELNKCTKFDAWEHSTPTCAFDHALNQRANSSVLTQLAVDGNASTCMHLKTNDNLTISFFIAVTVAKVVLKAFIDEVEQLPVKLDIKLVFQNHHQMFEQRHQSESKNGEFNDIISLDQQSEVTKLTICDKRMHLASNKKLRFCSVQVFGPDIIRNECGKPDVRMHCTANLINKTTVIYEADSEYKLSGAKTRYCHSGKWEPKSPSCIKNLQKFGNVNPTAYPTNVTEHGNLGTDPDLTYHTKSSVKILDSNVIYITIAGSVIVCVIVILSIGKKLHQERKRRKMMHRADVIKYLNPLNTTNTTKHKDESSNFLNTGSNDDSVHVGGFKCLNQEVENHAVVN